MTLSSPSSIPNFVEREIHCARQQFVCAQCSLCLSKTIAFFICTESLANNWWTLSFSFSLTVSGSKSDDKCITDIVLTWEAWDDTTNHRYVLRTKQNRRAIFDIFARQNPDSTEFFVQKFFWEILHALVVSSRRWWLCFNQIILIKMFECHGFVL